jgi:hypothetical protein
MRLLGFTSMAALVLALIPFQARGGGFQPDGKDVKAISDEYKTIHLPLSAKAARTWIALHETMVKPYPEKTPLRNVVQSLQRQIQGKDGQPAPFQFYLDPTTLQEMEIRAEATVSAPFLGDDEVSLHTYLSLLLREFGLVHRVHDSLVIIDTPCDDCGEEPKVTAPEAWTWLLLQQEVPISFPDETPLRDILKAVYRATAGKNKGGRSLLIHVDPVGLQEAEKSLDSAASIDLKHVPLCTTLGLLLKQLGLGFAVRDDGMLVISNDSMDLAPMDEAKVAEEYQYARYELFWKARMAEKEEERRFERTKPSEKPDHSAGAIKPRR